MHRNLMRIFRLYMLIGGMPQAVKTYLEHNNLQIVDEVKRENVDLQEEDFTKIDGTGLAGDIYDAIPANLSNNASMEYIIFRCIWCHFCKQSIGLQDQKY